jgi:hypothetical protein
MGLISSTGLIGLKSREDKTMITINCKNVGLLLIACLCMVCSSLIYAQNSITGVIEGRVQDKDHKPIGGAVIHATYTATGKVLATTSYSDGSYRMQFLAPGQYTLDCEHPSYNRSQENSVQIRVNAINPIGVPPFVLTLKSAAPSSSDKAMADAATKAKLAAAAKSRAAAQAKAKAEADARTKLAAEARAKAESDVKTKAEAEKRAKAEAGRKAAEESRVRAEAEAAARIEAEKAANAESQALLRAEEQARAEAELAVKAEANANAQLAALTSLPPIQIPPFGASQESKAARVVQSATPMRGDSFTEAQIQALPLSGIRTFDDLAFLVPGVSDPPEAIGQTAGPGIGAGVGSSGQFSVNGMRSRANNFTVDGSDNNDQDVAVRRQGFLTLLPQPIESIQEFQVSTLLWDEELGRNLGSQVNAVSKTGSNRVHGQAYGYLNDSRLNARNFFDYTPHSSGGKNPYTRLQTGIALSGPIVENRTHFFLSYEHQKINALKEEHFATPTDIERKFRAKSEDYKVITSLVSDNNLSDYAVIGAVTPLGSNLFSLYPLPNNPKGPFGPNNLASVLPASGGGDIFSVKTTHEFTPKHSLSARYSLTDDNRELPSIKRAISSTLDSDSRNQNLSLVFESALSGSLANQARFSFGRTRLDFDEHAGNPLYIGRETESVVRRIPKNTNGLATDLKTVRADPGPLGELIIRPFSPVGVDAFLFPQARVNNTFQFADTFSKMWLKHTLKFGADIRRVQLDSSLDRNYRPRIEVNNGILMTQNGVNPALTSSFLYGRDFANIGLVPSIQQVLTRNTPDSNIDLRFTELNFFLNDNYRVKPNFVLDFGLRYERNTVPTESNGIIESALQLKDLPAPSSTEACKGACAESFQSYNSAVSSYTKILAGREKMYDSDSNNFAFHIGFAWDPSNSGKMSLRGGYGIYFDTILGSVVGQSRNVFPNEIPFLSDTTFYGNDGIGANNLAFFSSTGGMPFLKGSNNQINGTSNDFAALVGNLFYNTQAGGLSFTLPEKALRTPYVQQWHFSLEREFSSLFVSAAYVGTKGTKLTRMLAPNGGSSVTPQQTLKLGNGPYPVISYDNTQNENKIVNQRRILSRTDASLGAYQTFANSANSNYHALQLEAHRRFYSNYSFTAAYTWSHAIDDVSDIIATAGAPSLPQDLSNLRADRGNASFDIRHRFSGSLIIDLPFYKNSRKGAGVLLGDWQISTIFTARTGQPYTLQIPYDANQDGNLSDRPWTTQGLTFFDKHQQRRILQTATDVTSFFALETPGNGSVGRNTVYADGLINWDLAIHKNFFFSDSKRLDFRTEFFNVLNHTNFGIPVATIGDPGFGLSTNTITNSRMIQFALKFVF